MYKKRKEVFLFLEIHLIFDEMKRLNSFNNFLKHNHLPLY